MGIFTAPKGLPKMSQRARRASLFITLFILERDNNNKNNRLDLNGSKGNINIPLLYYVLLTPGQPHSPPRKLLCIVYFLWGCIAGLKMIPVYESMRKNKRFLTAHPSSSKSVMLFFLVFTAGKWYSQSLRCYKRTYSIQYSVSVSPFNKDAGKCGSLFFFSPFFMTQDDM